MCDVTSCNHQCTDEHDNCGVLKGVLNLQCKLLLAYFPESSRPVLSRKLGSPDCGVRSRGG